MRKEQENDKRRFYLTGEKIVTCSIHPETGADVYVKEIKNMGLRPVFTAVTPEWEHVCRRPK